MALLIVLGPIFYLIGEFFSSKTDPTLEDGHVDFMTGHAWLIVVVVAYAFFFVVPTLCTLPIVLPIAERWKKLPRIVVFRTFKARSEVAHAEAIIRRNLVQFGNVFTLADRGVRVSLVARIPLLVGQMGLLHFRPGDVRGDRALKRLESVLQCPRLLAVQWLLSSRKVFAIRSSDSTWRRCVELLLAKADAVVMDISNPTDNVDWEFHEAMRRGLGEAIAFVADEAKAEAARAWLRLRNSDPLGRERELFLYCGASYLMNGLTERIAGILEKSSESDPVDQQFDLERLLARSVLTTLAVVLPVLLASAPYFAPDAVALASPFRGQLLNAYVYGGSRAALDYLVRTRAPGEDDVIMPLITDSDWEIRDMGIQAVLKYPEPQYLAPVVKSLGRHGKKTDRLCLSALKLLVQQFPGITSLEIAQSLDQGDGEFVPALLDVVPKYPSDEPDAKWQALLHSKAASARFFSALRGPKSRDPAFVLDLFEALSWKDPYDPRVFPGDTPILQSEVTSRLDDLTSFDLDGFPVGTLDPYARQGTLPATLAAIVAEKAEDDPYVQSLLADKNADVRQGALGALLRCKPIVPEGLTVVTVDARTAKLLDGISKEFLYDMLRTVDGCVDVRAAYTLALRRDARAVYVGILHAGRDRNCHMFALDLLALTNCSTPRTDGDAILDEFAHRGAIGLLKLHSDDFNGLSFAAFCAIASGLVRSNDLDSLDQLTVAFVSQHDELSDYGFADSMPPGYGSRIDTLVRAESDAKLRSRLSALKAHLQVQARRRSPAGSAT